MQDKPEKSVPFLLNDEQNRIIKFLAKSCKIMFLHSPYLCRTSIVRFFPFTKTHIGTEGWILWHSHDSRTGLHKTQDFHKFFKQLCNQWTQQIKPQENTWNGAALDSQCLKIV